MIRMLLIAMVIVSLSFVLGCESKWGTAGLGMPAGL